MNKINTYNFESVSINPIEQAKWLISNKNILDGMSCPPFISKETTGCRFCIIAANRTLRDVKLKRIDKKFKRP
ncbi:MAG: hypothetical protein HPY57_15190 [Ignavibacteria bacterium]|nr:hypothetical protein [Ignavibacteria bacterium]